MAHRNPPDSSTTLLVSPYPELAATALDNLFSRENVQRAARHADPSPTELYDRRGYNPEKPSAFFANY